MEVEVNLNLLLQKSYRLFLAVLIVGITVIPTYNAVAWDPEQGPILSLTGHNTQYDKKWYPDGKITINMSKDVNNLDEILVPVFSVYNRKTEAPIYSFKMTVKYDSSLFIPIGIVTEHPNPDLDPKYSQYVNTGEPTNPMPEYAGKYTSAHGFTFTMNERNDNKYLNYLDIYHTDNNYGKALTITATGSQPLPNTTKFRNMAPEACQFIPMFYIKMKVRPVVGLNTNIIGKNSWIILDPTSIKYNEDSATPEYAVAGYSVAKTKPEWQTLPVLKGTVVVNFVKNGSFDFNMTPIVGAPIRKIVAGTTYSSYDEYELVDPITVDSGRVVDNYGYRILELINNEPESRINEITVTSSEKWLKVSPQPYRDMVPRDNSYLSTNFVPYLDNGILAVKKEVANDNKYTDSAKACWLNIKCDPNSIEAYNNEVAGKYVAYLTFKAKSANSNPARLKVTFIVLRPAYEPTLYPNETTAEVKHGGIRLFINQTDNSKTQALVFGVAPRATDEIDTLMGERAFLEPRSSFEARWYPVDPALATKYPHGFKDALPDVNRPDYNSRDIRSIYDTLNSITYLCKFNTPKYPLYITWYPADFPEGSVLYLKDNQTSGKIFSVNMREAAPANEAGKLSYTFTNATLNEFKIEYTLPKVIKFVNDTGAAIIQKGWNMLSLQVRPANAKWNVVYPNALSTPLVFVPSVWDRVTEDLKPGQGFFMYYGNIVDKSFSGAQITKIDASDKIRIVEGWNLIGALSMPTSFDNVSFVKEVESLPVPDINYTREYSLWGYKTNEGYYESSQLLPGMGYFIKAGSADTAIAKYTQGYLVINRSNSGKINSDLRTNVKENAYRNSSIINVMDNEQKASRVYLTSDKNINANKFEMPPVIGDEYFDVRFSNNANLSNDDNSVIKMNGVQYPVSIKVQNSDADLFFYDAVNGNLLGVAPKNAAKGVEVKSTVANAIKVVRGEIEFNAYPNPVTTSAQVKFTVPEAGRVSVKLYDALGNVVRELVDADMNASVQNIDFDANSLSSGSYMLKLTVGSYTVSRTVNIVK
jgi:hypothetical protein